MQQLHVVGFTTDSDSLILSAKKGAKSGSFVVPVDERLLEVIAEAVRRRNAKDDAAPLKAPPELFARPEPPRRSSLLSPREIQARLRAGRSVADVAREAAVDEEWVSKFAPPVEAERARIVSRARELVYARPRRGPSAEPLGLSVRWNLADRGIRLIDDEFDGSWSAYFVADTTWGITFRFANRGRRQTAEWEVDFSDGELIARNRVAADLGYVEPGRRRRAASLVPPPPPESAAPRRASGAGRDDGAAQGVASRAATAAGVRTQAVSSATKAKTTRAKATKAQATKARATPTKAKATKAQATKAQATKAQATKAKAKGTGTGTRTTARVAKAVGRARTGTTGRTPTALPARPVSARVGQAAKGARSAKSVKAAAKIAKVPGRKTASKASRTTKTAKRSGAAKRAARPRVDEALGAGGDVTATAAPARNASRPASGNELARRRLELIGKSLPATRSARPRSLALPSAQPARRRDAERGERPPAGEADVETAVEQVPSATAVTDDGARDGRRQARSQRASRADGGRREQARPRGDAPSEQAAPNAQDAESPTPPTPLQSLPSPQAERRSLPEDSAIPADEGRVVTIRASRAGTGDVVVPGGPRPLRPAQPAAQPRRRRFGRNR